MAAVIGLLDILMCDDCLTNEQYSTIAQIDQVIYLFSQI